MRKFFLLFLCVSLAFAASARRYYTGIGLRAGKFSSGVTFKHFYNTDNATGIQIDAMYSNMSADGFTLKGYYLKQIPFKIPIIQLPLDLVLGGGLHAAYFPFQNNNGYYKRVNADSIYRYPASVVTAGINATVQIEYRIPVKKVPFTVSIDCNPFYEFYKRGPEWLDFGFSVRYVFL
jgi:hypothetical protein